VLTIGTITDVVDVQGPSALAAALVNEDSDCVQGIAAWALGHIGNHVASHATAVIQADVLPRLLRICSDESVSERLAYKVSPHL